MSQPDPASQSWPAIDEQTLRLIDEEARKRCTGDAAMWFHHRALLEGEFRIRNQGKKAWTGWVLARTLPQFKIAEASVIEGWRKFLENALLLPREQQADIHAINRAIIFDGCRRARNEQQLAGILQARAPSICEFAATGQVPFFRTFGRLLNPSSRSPLQAYDYVHAMLSHWLTSHLWLMPERTASDCLAGWRGQKPKTTREGDKVLWHFKKTKHGYKLKSHRPSLVGHIESDGMFILTPQGRSLFRSLIRSK
jgi:hypothetical protein